jgi:hypothetical protein
MRQRGGDGVEISSDLSIEPIYEQYRDREGVRQDSERADQIANYSASITLSVEIRDIARASDVRAAALAAGPQDAEQLVYYLRETTEMQRQVFAAAVEDAAARARLAAQGSRTALGPLLALQEGQGPCLGEWRGTRPAGSITAEDVGRFPDQNLAEALPQVMVAGSRGQLTLTAEQIARLQLPSDPQPVVLEARVCAVFAAAP